jgi:putative sigma-54 modulation protein
MTVNYTARQTALTPEIERYCERRVGFLEKLFGYPIETDVILSVEKYRHKVEVNVKTKGGTLNAISETQDMLSSLGDAFDNVERRAKKEKDKLRERKRRKSRESSPLPPEPAGAEEGRRVIRSQSYSLKPMSVEEALLLFEARKDEVFVFRKFESEKWAVLYRRNDGHFGIVDPE